MFTTKIFINSFLSLSPIQKSCLSETTFTKRFNKLVELLLAAKHITPSSVDWAKKSAILLYKIK